MFCCCWGERYIKVSYVMLVDSVVQVFSVFIDFFLSTGLSTTEGGVLISPTLQLFYFCLLSVLSVSVSCISKLLLRYMKV